MWTMLAVAAATFNLACAGTQTLPTGATTAVDYTFRIDTVARQYCEGACQLVRPLAGVNDATIVLLDAAIVRGGKRATLRQEIDRATLTFRAVATRENERAAATAACTTTSFTGFGDAVRETATIETQPNASGASGLGTGLGSAIVRSADRKRARDAARRETEAARTAR